MSRKTVGARGGWALAAIAVGAGALSGGQTGRADRPVIRGPVIRTLPGNRPPVVIKKKLEPIGQRYIVTGKWYVTNADDGTNWNGTPDKKVEIKGEVRYDGKSMHSRTLSDPGVIIHAGNWFLGEPLVVDYYFDRPGSKMMRVSGEYVDWDQASGNDLMWRHDENIDLEQVLRDGRGPQGRDRSGELLLTGDNNSESLDITVKVTEGPKLYK